MNWLFDNYKWLFDGVGGAAVLTFIGLLIHRRFKTSPYQPVTPISKVSSMSNSSVAAGSGINQNVNAPVINIKVGQSAPVAAQSKPSRPASAPYVRPLPRMIVTGVRATRVQRVSHGVWTESRPAQDAFVVQFTNEARLGGPNVGGLVKAHLVFRDARTELCRITGCWLEQEADMTEFRVDDTHSLLVGLMSGGQFTTVAKHRVRVDVNTDEISADVTDLANYQQGVVFVRLTHGDTGDVLYEGQFRVTANPLSIVPA